MKFVKSYACPHCNEVLEEVSGCGSVSYFCNQCKKLISRKEIVEISDNKGNK